MLVALCCISGRLDLEACRQHSRHCRHIESIESCVVIVESLHNNLFLLTPNGKELVEPLAVIYVAIVDVGERGVFLHFTSIEFLLFESLVSSDLLLDIFLGKYVFIQFICVLLPRIKLRFCQSEWLRLGIIWIDFLIDYHRWISIAHQTILDDLRPPIGQHPHRLVIELKPSISATVFADRPAFLLYVGVVVVVTIDYQASQCIFRVVLFSIVDFVKVFELDIVLERQKKL